MGAEHGQTLHYRGHSPVHRMPANVKILALLGFVLAVVASPRELIWPYPVHLVLVLAVVAKARVPVAYLLKRLAIDIPFVFLAVLMPFVATGPTTTFLGLTVSQSGLWGAWALLAKGTLSVLAALTLAATTEARDLLAGLRRLRLPQQLVEIMGFMIRYIDVIAEQWHRMQIARASRGFRATSPAAWRVLSSSLGTLFIRSYERGERVHLAMLSRGYTGNMPIYDAMPARLSQWISAAIVPTAAAIVAGVAWGIA